MHYQTFGRDEEENQVLGAPSKELNLCSFEFLNKILCGMKPAENSYLWVRGEGYLGDYFPNYLGSEIIFYGFYFGKFRHFYRS